ncbi:hypothetical protein KP806_23575 [Paenibacillus sp. N4]|uniref:hypothetical protein n=1 Tax=Paenibacillus vietnamensis TaxID=2590547 RepID=UPI001CD1708C|nr:hypothetical protein [Paenibacillus vietnamensis]MCA0758044.1 hypothetical protein [Paenibacillus vietnamensis]
MKQPIVKKGLALFLAAIMTGLLLTGCGARQETAGDNGAVRPEVRINDAADGAAAGAGVFLPKLQLPEQENAAAADMIGLIVYKGKIYTQTGSRIAPGKAADLRGAKLGRTKPAIDEWSSQDDFATEFASSVGEKDVYSVKGYESGFRIMTYEEYEGKVYAEFYECLNGIPVTSGADVFSKLKLDGNVRSAVWETHDSWNYNKQEYRELQAEDAIPAFLEALSAAQPIEQQTLQATGIYDNTEQKILYLKLADETVVGIRLFEGRYVRYQNAHVFFQLEEKAFDALWDHMKE